MRPTVNSIEELGNGQAVVVGRVKLVPPIGKDEVLTKGIIIGKDRMKNHVFLAVGPKPYVMEGTPDNSVYEGAIETPWNELFFSRFDSGNQYLQMAMYTLVMTTSSDGGGDFQRGFLVSNLKLNVKKEDEVVYIGTIVLYRNDFNQLEKVQVLDESDYAYKEIRERFGRKTMIRKALAARS
jgi:hypothetical protein